MALPLLVRALSQQMYNSIPGGLNLNVINYYYYNTIAYPFTITIILHIRIILLYYYYNAMNYYYFVILQSIIETH